MRKLTCMGIWQRAVASGWLMRTVVEQRLSCQPAELASALPQVRALSGVVWGIAVNRRLSLRWFEPNTCHHVKSQVTGLMVGLPRLSGGERGSARPLLGGFFVFPGQAGCRAVR